MRRSRSGRSPRPARPCARRATRASRSLRSRWRRIRWTSAADQRREYRDDHGVGRIDLCGHALADGGLPGFPRHHAGRGSAAEELAAHPQPDRPERRSRTGRACWFSDRPSSGTSTGGLTRAEATRHFIDGLAAVAPQAEERGVTVLPEALPSNQSDIVNTLAETSGIVREIGSPAIRTMFDVHNTLDETEPHATLVERHFDVIRHVHVNEMDGKPLRRGRLRFQAGPRACFAAATMPAGFRSRPSTLLPERNGWPPNRCGTSSRKSPNCHHEPLRGYWRSRVHRLRNRAKPAAGRRGQGGGHRQPVDRPRTQSRRGSRVRSTSSAPISATTRRSRR